MNAREFTKRLKIVRVDQNLLIDLLNGFRNQTVVEWPDIPEIPADAEAIEFNIDYYRRCVTVTLCHESFDVVSDGETIPVIDGLFLERKSFRRIPSPRAPAGGIAGLKAATDALNCVTHTVVIAEEKLEQGDFVVWDEVTGKMRKSPIQVEAESPMSMDAWEDRHMDEIQADIAGATRQSLADALAPANLGISVDMAGPIGDFSAGVIVGVCGDCNGKGKIQLFSSSADCEACGGTGEVLQPVENVQQIQPKQEFEPTAYVKVVSFEVDTDNWMWTLGFMNSREVAFGGSTELLTDLGCLPVGKVEVGAMVAFHAGHPIARYGGCSGMLVDGDD